MTDQTETQPTDWIDGHPQLEAIAAVVWEQCERSDSGLVIDDPRNIAVAALAALLPAPVDRAAVLTAAERTMLTYALDQAQERIWSEDGFTEEDQAAVTSLRRMADETQQPEAMCVCGHPERQHFEDVCLTECGCGDFLTAEAAAEEITRLRQIVRQREDAVDTDTLARLMCDADVFVNDGDYPGWDDLSTTPGLGKDEVRKAARYLMRRLHITLHDPAAAAQQPQGARP